MPRLKVCGINDAAFAVEAARRGVDYLGLIFAAKSPRCVSVEAARRIVDAVRASAADLPRFVGVFVRHSASDIAEIASSVKLDVVQLHGEYTAEDVAFLKSRGHEVWLLQSQDAAANAAADAVLLDGRDGARCGGTGMRADWSLVGELKRANRRVVLAGGLSSANIADAAATSADVLDVNSSIETSPGVKSLELLDGLLGALPTHFH